MEKPDNSVYVRDSVIRIPEGAPSHSLQDFIQIDFTTLEGGRVHMQRIEWSKLDFDETRNMLIDSQMGGFLRSFMEQARGS